MINKQFVMLAGAAAMFLAAASSHAVLIDGFGDIQAAVTDSTNGVGGVTSAPIVVTDTGLTGTVSRTITADAISGAVPSVRDVTAGVALGSYSHSQDTGVRGLSSADWTFVPAQDLSTSGLAIEILVLFADLPGAHIDFILTDALANTFTQTVNIAAGSNYSLFVPLAGFTGVNLTQLASGSLVVDGTQVTALDVEIDLVQTVPEPASVALVGLGLLGLGGARLKARRRTT